MSILDSFRDWQTTDALIERITTVDNTTTGDQDETSSTIGTLKCIFWVGKQAERVVAEKIRGTVSAVAIFDPGSDVKLHDDVTVNGIEYNALDPDNVALQDEAVVVPLGAKK